MEDPIFMAYTAEKEEEERRRIITPALQQTEEIYVNSKNVSHKHKKRPLGSFLRMK